MGRMTLRRAAARLAAAFTTAAAVALAALPLVTCSNPVDLVEAVTVEVMKGNDRYLEVVALRALTTLDSGLVSPGSIIEIEFDRAVDVAFDPASLVRAIDKDGDAKSMALVSFDESGSKVRIVPVPYFDSSDDYTITINGCRGADGEVQHDTASYSFGTGIAPAGTLSLVAKATDTDAVAGYARSLTISASVSANQVTTKYCLANSASELDPPPADGPIWKDVVNTASSDWSLPAGSSGDRSVYVLFRQFTGSKFVYSLVGSALITYDKDPPSVSAGADVWGNSARTLAGSASDPYGIASYTWSGAGLTFGAPSSASTSATASTEGAKTASLTAKDRAGNQASDSLTFTWDVTKPTVAPFAIAGGAEYLTTISTTVSTTFSDNLSNALNCQYRIYNSAVGWTSYLNPASGTLSGTVAFLATDDSIGRYVYFYVYDQAGNYQYAYDYIKVDVIAPSVPTLSVSSAKFLSTPTWSWSSGGGGCGLYSYSLDGASGVTTTALSYTSGSAMTEDVHSLAVQECDAAGNWSATSSRSYVVTEVFPYANQTGVSLTPTLEWRRVGDLYTYSLQYYNSGWQSAEPLLPGSSGMSSTSYTVSSKNPLPANTTFRWRVRATLKTLTVSVPDDSGRYFTTRR